MDIKPLQKYNNLSDEHFENFGPPKPNKPLGTLDYFRYDFVYRSILPGSVLDVGTYYGDFLKMALDDGREIYGTDINQARVDLSNRLIGKNVVVEDFRNGNLKQFSDNSIDNVICMEAVEHVPDDRHAVHELCRVARNNVVVTVPFRERILEVLCVHCNTYTPHSCHMHSYDMGIIANLLPAQWQVIEEEHFGKRLTRFFAARLPNTDLSRVILKIVDNISFGTGAWLKVTLRPEK